MNEQPKKSNWLKRFLKKTFHIPGIRFQSWRFRLPAVGTSVEMPSIFGLRLPPIRIGLPQWAGIRVRGGVWKVGFIATGLGLFATAGIFFATTANLEQSPVWPDPAQYDAGVAYKLDSKTLKVGQKNRFSEDTPSEQRHTQTLKVIIGGARISDLTFENISLGKATGLAEGLQIVGTATNTLQCDEIIIDGLEAPSLVLSDANIYELIIKDNFADGLSLSPTLTGVSDITVGSTRGALSIPSVADSTYDRIIIDTSGGDAICNTLTLKNIKLFGTYSGTAVDLKNIDAGTLTIQNSVIGDGTGIDVASMTINTTTIISTCLLYTSDAADE